MKLSDAKVRAAKPGDKIIKLSDGHSLQLWIRPTGQKSWRRAYRYEGRQRDIVLGAYPAMSLAEARAANLEIDRVLAAGVDPQEDRRAQRVEEAVNRAGTFKVIADELLKFVRQHKDEPFFVYYPTVLPHLALQVPDAELSAYEGEWTETPYEGKSYLPHPKPRAAYASMISFMDRQVGRVMDLLKELGLDENTLVIFTSDNGTTFLKEQVDFEFFDSVGGLRGLKGEIYEGGIRVPLLARWPGKIAPGTVSDHPSAHYDAMATLAEVAGAELTQAHDGISYLPTLLGTEQKAHEYLAWDFGGYGGQIAIREGDWKALKRNLRKDPDAPLELYNLATDRSETTNVAATHPKVAARLEKLLIEARAEPELERFRFGVYGGKE